MQATAAPEAPAKQTWERPDAAGRFGKFGGKYVPETLIPALAELEVAYQQAMADPAFQVGTCKHHACGNLCYRFCSFNTFTDLQDPRPLACMLLERL